MNVEDVLHQKALDQVAHLLGSYEAGNISGESFKVGVETIWACLGGVVDIDAFKELMEEANAEIAALPSPVHVELFVKEASLVALMRDSKVVRMCATAGGPVKVNTFDDVFDAVAHTKKMRSALCAKGYEEFRQ